MPRFPTRPALCLAILFCSSVNGIAADDERRALAALYDKLKAPDVSTRVAAARDLGQFRPVYRGALLQLIDSLGDPAPEVRTAVHGALLVLSSAKGFKKAASGLNRAPRVLSLAQAAYPVAARAAGVEGTVYLEFLVTADGSVTDVRVLKSVPPLDAAAVEAAKKFLFQPAVRDGRLVETIAQAPMIFRDDPPPPWLEKP